MGGRGRGRSESLKGAFSFRMSIEVIKKMAPWVEEEVWLIWEGILDLKIPTCTPRTSTGQICKLL